MKERPLRDKERIREIIRILIEPYGDLGHLSVETKLWSTFQPQNFPIYRRKIIGPLKVYGMWWMDEEQYCRFMWHGYKNSIVIKSDQDPDRVLTTRSFLPKGWCYIRKTPNDIYDIEAMSMTTIKGDKAAASWMTCSITSDEYKRLDNSFGPIQNEICKHTFTKEWFDDY